MALDYSKTTHKARQQKSSIFKKYKEKKVQTKPIISSQDQKTQMHGKAVLNVPEHCM